MGRLNHALRAGEPIPLPLPLERRRYDIHPLFPLPEGVEETKDIYEITFDRWDHQGRKERCPERFLASELTSLAQVVDIFGGGTYQFIAYDRHGAFSRWTAEKDKVRIGVPCKPLRTVEPQSTPAPVAPPEPAPNQGSELIALLIAAQERTDRMLMMLVDRLASMQAPQVAPVAPVVAPAPIDPMAMLTGLATILEKFRPAQSGDMMGQLSALVGLVKQLGGERAPSATPEEASLQKLINTMTEATASSPAAPAPLPAPVETYGHDLIWVDLPPVGLVRMRPEQAAKVCAQLAASSAPSVAASSPPSEPFSAPPAHAAPAVLSAPPSLAQPFATSWDDIAVRLQNPAEQLALKQAIERMLASSTPASSTAAAPSPERPLTSPPVPAPSSPAPPASPPVSSPVRAAPPVAVPVAAPPAASVAAAQVGARSPAAPALASAVAGRARCLVCGASGTLDPAQPNVLTCPNSHRSLLAPTPTGHTERIHDRAPLDPSATEEPE